MITPAKYIAENIFKLDMPIEELHPRQAMLLKHQVLEILIAWQKEQDIVLSKAINERDKIINNLELEVTSLIRAVEEKMEKEINK